MFLCKFYSQIVDKFEVKSCKKNYYINNIIIYIGEIFKINEIAKIYLITWHRLPVAMK